MKQPWYQKQGLVAAIAVLLEILAAALAFLVSLAAETDLGEAALWALRGATGAAFFAGIAAACWAVALEVRPTLEPRVARNALATILLVTAAVGAGALAGSAIADATSNPDRPPAEAARRLENVFARLSTEQRANLHQLQVAKNRGDQRAAAEELADLFAVRARDLLRSTPRRGAGVEARLGRAMLSVRDAYARLGEALGDPDGDQQQVDQSSRLVRQRVNRMRRDAMTLWSLGYVVVAGR